MRLLIAFLFTTLLLISCSNFYPIIISTPVNDDSVIVDTIIPSDTIDTNGNYLSRDTIFKSLEEYDSSFEKIISLNITDDSATSLYFYVDSMYRTEVKIIQNNKNIPYEIEKNNDRIFVETDNLQNGDANIFISNYIGKYSDIFTRIYIQKKDSFIYTNPNFGSITRVHQNRLISKHQEVPINDIGANHKITVVTNDTLKGVFIGDSLISVFIVDEENYKKFLFDDPTIEYMYLKNRAEDTLALPITVTESIYYIVENRSDSTLAYTDSLNQIR